MYKKYKKSDAQGVLLLRLLMLMISTCFHHSIKKQALEDNWYSNRVSDRFSIESISLDGSTTATENFVCTPPFPITNDNPICSNHLSITCNVKIMSSGKCYCTGFIMKCWVQASDGYRIDAQWPQLANFPCGHESPMYDNPQAFWCLRSSTVAKYELVYKMNDGITGSIPEDELHQLLHHMRRINLIRWGSIYY